MTATARSHFEEDIERVESLLNLANGRSPVVLHGHRKNDLRLGAVAMAVGAMDAYFCDAYVDCLAVALRRHRQDGRSLPQAYAKQRLPAGELLNQERASRPNWALRMAARSIMEKENVLDLESVKKLLNPVLPEGHKLWPNVMEPLILLDWKRLTGIRKADYLALSDPRRKGARIEAVKAMKTRVKKTIQYRHDWIHNCGRPKVAITQMSSGQSIALVREVKAIVRIVDDHLSTHRFT